MPMPIHVVLPILRNQILRAWLIRKQVMALPVGRGFLHYVPDIKRRKIRISPYINAASPAAPGVAMLVPE